MTIWIYIPYCLKMHSLTPFNPTPLERQDPLTREYQREATLLKSLTPPQKLSGHDSSGSEWSEVEVNAVRAVPSLDQDPSRIIFEQYFPIDDDQGIYLRNISISKHFAHVLTGLKGSQSLPGLSVRRA